MEEIWQLKDPKFKAMYKDESYRNALFLMKNAWKGIDIDVDEYGNNVRDKWILGKLEKIISDHNEKSWLMAGHSLSEEDGQNKLIDFLNNIDAFPHALGEDTKVIIANIINNFDKVVLDKGYCAELLTKIKTMQSKFVKHQVAFIGHSLAITLARSNYENFKLIHKINKAYDALRIDGDIGISVLDGSSIANMLKNSKDVGRELEYILNVLENPSTTQWSFEESMLKISKVESVSSTDMSKFKAEGEKSQLPTSFYTGVSSSAIHATIKRELDINVSSI